MCRRTRPARPCLDRRPHGQPHLHHDAERTIHGMPLAALLGHGDAMLTSIDGTGPELGPENVCLIGARSYEAGEPALLHRLDVRVFAMKEVRRRGMAEVFAAALAIARRGTAGFGRSINLDALDPEEESPGSAPRCPGAWGVPGSPPRCGNCTTARPSWRGKSSSTTRAATARMRPPTPPARCSTRSRHASRNGRAIRSAARR